MIRVFRATDTNYTANGEVILKPISAIITKNIEEEYIEVEAPLKYAEFLIQENILIMDTLAGKKGYRIHNPVASNTINVKAWLCYQEKPSLPADRGVVIAHGKNLANCEIDENWDDVVTKLTPIGYKGARLPEVYLSVPSPYQKIYEKEIEFDLAEELEEEVEALEEEVDTNQSIVTSLETSIVSLSARISSAEKTIVNLQNEKTTLQQRLSELGTTEPELKEKAVIEAQIPLINSEITSINGDIANAETLLDQAQSELVTAKVNLTTSQIAYNNMVQGDLRSQAVEYLNINKYPQINYDLEAHLEGIVEVGDTVKVKHPDMRIDLLTNVILYEWDCLTKKFTHVEFGTQKPSLKGRLADIEEKVDKTNDTVKKVGNTITKYKSEYKRDNEEMVSKFISELYGMNNGIYGMIQKNQSVLRQTASEISGTVSRINADLSSDIASLVIQANQISSTVSSNYTTLDGKINTNASSITQTATTIRSEVSTAINGVNQSISTVEQTANKISWLVKSGSSSSNFTLTDRAISLVAANIDLTGLVTISSLSTPGSVVIDGGNIKANSLTANSIKAGGTITGNKFTNGSVTIDDNDITINGINGYIYGKYANNTTPLIGYGGNTNTIYIGGSSWVSDSKLYMRQRYITIGYSTSYYPSELTLSGYKMAFYDALPVTKQTVNKVYPTTVTTQDLAYRFNAFLTAMHTLGLTKSDVFS